MRKISALEDTTISDPNSGKIIRISTSTRIYFRRAFPDYSHVRNERLNLVIAKEFAKASSKVLHYFPLKKGTGKSSDGISEDMAQIRGNKNYFFIGIVRGSNIDVIAVQTSWLKPRYARQQEV